MVIAKKLVLWSILTVSCHSFNTLQCMTKNWKPVSAHAQDVIAAIYDISKFSNESNIFKFYVSQDEHMFSEQDIQGNAICNPEQRTLIALKINDENEECVVISPALNKFIESSKITYTINDNKEAILSVSTTSGVILSLLRTLGYKKYVETVKDENLCQKHANIFAIEHMSLQVLEGLKQDLETSNFKNSNFADGLLQLTCQEIDKRKNRSV